MFWLPQPLYNAKPVVFLLAALSLCFLTKNVFVTLFAVYVLGYSAWIIAMRLMWNTSVGTTDLNQ